MSHFRKGFRVSILTVLFGLGILSMALEAADFGPRQRPGNRTRQTNQVQSVAEPAAIVLLGAGLVSLGIFAKRKYNRKK